MTMDQVAREAGVTPDLRVQRPGWPFDIGAGFGDREALKTERPHLWS